MANGSGINRKKKCDENHPRCSDCRRLNLPCQWPSRRTESEISNADSPDSYATEFSEVIQIDDADGSLLPIGSETETPDNDEDFIASLFPHPLPKPSARIPTLDWSPISTNPHLHSDQERSLFNHYIHVVARALSRSHDSDRNPFLVTLLPLAQTSSAVTSVLLSLSGCHWKRVYPTIWGCALKRQGQGACYTHA